MIDEEIYLLIRHAHFQADYIEKLPIYRRRHYLFLLQKEFEEIEKAQEKAKNKNYRPR